MGVYRKLAILTRGTLRYARGTPASTLVYATSTLPYFNFLCLTGTVPSCQTTGLGNRTSQTNSAQPVFELCFLQ